MTDSGKDIETRVTILERGYAQLREQNALASSDAAAGRMLASAADRDVSEVRAELRAHTSALNALRETQLEQGWRISGLENRVAGLENRVVGLEQKMTEGFAMLATGMAQITALLSGNASSAQS